MTWPVKFLLRGALLLVLTGVCVLAVQADGLTLTAAFGLGGHYRPGTWCPVSVTVQNPGGEAVSGQIQVLATPAPGRPNYGGTGGNLALEGALFASPVSISSRGPQRFTVYVRGIDPGRDSVTVQLTEGRERGDGRILARTDNEPTNGTPTITGTPLGDQDLFFTGFAGDPGAFTSLRGLKVGLSHQAGGVAVMPPPNSAVSTGTTQIVSPGAADLPDRAAGYSGLDAFLLRGDAPLDGLTEAQADALKGWVASGGHLIVFCLGADPSPFAASFYQGFLPAAVGPAGADGRVTLTPKPLPGVETTSGSPLCITGHYGAGRVTVTNFDPATAGVGAPLTAGTVWQTLLIGRGSPPSALLPHVAAREENYAANYYGPGQALLSDAVMRAPALDAPGTEIIGLFLLVYLIALVPTNYLILKRMDRKELAWVTIPLLVLIFAVGTFGVGYAAKGGAVFLNRAAIMETSSGHREAAVYADIGLFSPHRTSYDVTLPGANVLAAIPNPGVNYGYRSSGSAETQANGQTKFVQTAAGNLLLDTSVNMWAMRAFDVQSTADLGGTIDSALMEKSGPPMPASMSLGISGTLTNHLPCDLTDCAVLYRGQWQPLGSLARGATLPVTFGAIAALNNRSPGFNIPPLPGETNKDDPHGDIRRRMRSALADYARSLGQQNGNYYYGNGQPPAAAYSPSSHEVLLLGWSDDPALAGPAPRIDGHPVQENDAVLLVVHLPINPNPVVD